MKTEGILKHLTLALLCAIVGYFVLYYGIEQRRTRKGPWEVAFTTTVSGQPAILVNQSALGIAGVEVSFPDIPAPATNTFKTMHFGEARPVPYDVPFGKCIFMDTTFLPGTVTLLLFGHEIELLPRVLVIDRRERAWVSGRSIEVRAPHSAKAPPK